MGVAVGVSVGVEVGVPVGVVDGVTVELGNSVGSEPWLPLGWSWGPEMVPSCVVVPAVAGPLVAFLAGASPPSVCWLLGSPARPSTFWLLPLEPGS